MVNRRNALKILIRAAAGVFLLGSAACSRRDKSPQKREVLLGSADDIEPGITYLPLKRLALVRDESGIAAISMVCTHMTCALRHEGDRFVCPCHGSKFTTDGVVLNGPATEDLTHYRVYHTEQGGVAVDLGESVPATARYVPEMR